MRKQFVVARRNLQLIAVLAIAAWTVFFAIHTSRYSINKQDLNWKRNVAFKYNHHEFGADFIIPQIYMENYLNSSLHDYPYILQPLHNDACLSTANNNTNLLSVQATNRISSSEYLKDARPLFALFLIHSKAGHFEHRKIIRKTWGSIGNKITKFVFLLGNPNNKTLQVLVKRENSLYGDILQEDFLETYRNITLKAIMALKWASQQCSGTKFVVKVDDDVYVDIKSILRIITNPQFQRRRLLLCHPTINAPVLRTGKYAISKSLYAANKWPTYCFGGGWIASSDVIEKLYQVSLKTKQIHLDDVFITGILRTKIHQKIYRAKSGGKVFCHTKGKPNLIEQWWNESKNVTKLKTIRQNKWMDCVR